MTSLPLLADFTEAAGNAIDVTGNASSTVQFFVIIFQWFMLLGFLGWYIYKHFDQKAVTERFELERQRAAQQLVIEKERAADALKAFRSEHEAKLTLKQEEIQELKTRHAEERGRLNEQIARGQVDLEALETLLKTTDAELHVLQKRFDHLGELEASIWISPPKHGTTPIPQFVPPTQRRARFISLLNLKGGVGKTTLTANLAGALATAVSGRPLSILVVDLDFQGTLSNSCVESQFLNDRRINDLTSTLLLDADFEPGSMLKKLVVPMESTQGRGVVIVANEDLDRADFLRQAHFAVRDEEIRFEFRRFFHDSDVSEQFDLIFFDCPPRLTSSSTNALLASDFVLIPTNVCAHDVDALPRTLRHLTEMRSMNECRARLLGVAVNGTYRATSVGETTRDEKREVERIQHELTKWKFPVSALFSACVPHSNRIAQADLSGRGPLGTDSEKGHQIYGALANEILQRIDQLEPFAPNNTFEAINS